ncbi:hypothetical protein [Albibacterium indicum]|uniref:hypothetical protein n=1 Tax=Albibacterium indicum TaxID=2292082 RepID=UPI000E47B5DB|nr:hypothetical protein [Pedobacter indicus]
MKRTIILTVFLFIVMIIVSILYFSQLKQTQNINSRSISSIPADAALLITLNNDSSFFDLFKDYEGFRLVMGSDEMDDLKTLQQFVLQNTMLKMASMNQPLYFSFHPENEQIEWLLSIPLKENMDIEAVKNGLDSTLNLTVNGVGDTSFIELEIPDIERKIYTSILPDRAILSFSKPLMERALNNSEDHLSELFLEKFKTNFSANAPLQAYVNHEKLPELLSLIASKTTSPLALFENLNGISAFDLNYKSDVLMFSGTMSIVPTDSSYLSLFMNQEPVSYQLKNWIPDHTALVEIFGVSDYEQFHDGIRTLLENRAEIDQLQEQFRYIKSKENVVIDDELLRIWGNEFAKLTLRSGEEIGIIAIRDSLEYAQIAEKISTPNADSTVWHFDNSNLLYYSLGDPFKNFKRPYFTYTHGYMILANRPSNISNYLDDIEAGNLLIEEEEYQAYENLQSTTANYSLFIHRENADRTIRNNLNRQMRQNYQDSDNYGFEDFYAFSFQLSGNDDRFITNLYGQFKLSEK